MRTDILRRRLKAGLPEMSVGRRRWTGARWSGGCGCAADEASGRLVRDGAEALRWEDCGQGFAALVRRAVGGVLVGINDVCL
jgi:hypothetical protein